MKRTPLFATHQKLGGKLIEFGGWEMPVQYTTIMDEHLAVRKSAGLFDISHMGEVLVQGAGAEAFLNQTLTNDIRKVAIGQGQYTLMCKETGGVIDDLYAYRLGSAEYLLIINASRIHDDIAWLERQLATASNKAEVTLENVSEQMGAIAVQGPTVSDFIDKCFPGPSLAGTDANKISDLKKNQIAKTSFERKELWIARTGYTGEDGFEVVTPAALLEPVWNQVVRAGKQSGIKPAGLGARDTLRTEVCYPLYGHELDEMTTPIEAGLSSFVSFDKGEFAGRTLLLQQKEQGAKKRLVPFRMTGKSAPPRPHYQVWQAGADGRRLGEVTSGTQSPSLGIGIGMAYVLPDTAAVGTQLEIEIREKRFPAEVVRKPIYRKRIDHGSTP
jgi:aminomethyltransferase